MATKTTTTQSIDNMKRTIEKYKNANELNANVEFVTFETEGSTVEGVYMGIKIVKGNYGDRPYWQVDCGKDGIKLLPETMQMSISREVLTVGQKVAVMFAKAVTDERGNVSKKFRVFTLD